MTTRNPTKRDGGQAWHRFVMCVVMLVAVAFDWKTAVGEEPAGGTVTVVLDATYQSAIEELSRAENKESFERTATRLAALDGPDRAQLVSQLLWYAARHRDDVRSQTAVGRALRHIDAPKSVVIRALVPHLENSDEVIRTMVQDLLHGYEDASAERPPDFSTYRSILEADVRAGREPRESLVRFMYDTDPGEALRTMVRATGLRRPEEIKPILWGEHVVAELIWKRRFGFVERTAVDVAVVQELDKLARNSRWWVRLYAASIVQSCPELATADMTARLGADARAAVSHAVGSVKSQSSAK